MPTKQEMLSAIYRIIGPTCFWEDRENNTTNFVMVGNVLDWILDTSDLDEASGWLWESYKSSELRKPIDEWSEEHIKKVYNRLPTK